jgi:hypothetical protein
MLPIQAQSTRRALIASACALLVFAGGVQAQVQVQAQAQASEPSTAAQDAVITEALTRSGITQTIDRLPALVTAGFQAEPDIRKLPADRRKTLERGMREAFNPALMRAEIIAIMRRNYDEAPLRATSALYATPLGQRMVKLESELLGDKAMQQVERYLRELDRKPLPDARARLLARIDRATRATDSGIDLQIGLARAMLIGLNAAQPREQRMPADLLDKLTRSLRDQAGPAIRLQIFGSLAYAYRNASDAELTEYVQGLEAEPVRWSVFVMTQALSAAVIDASERMGRLLGDLLGPKGQRTPV